METLTTNVDDRWMASLNDAIGRLKPMSFYALVFSLLRSRRRMNLIEAASMLSQHYQVAMQAHRRESIVGVNYVASGIIIADPTGFFVKCGIVYSSFEYTGRILDVATVCRLGHVLHVNLADEQDR